MDSRQARRNRQRGAETEREIIQLLHRAGVAAEKISRTGYTGPDICIQDDFLCESKHRKSGFKTLKLWLREAEVVFIREERIRKPMVVMTFDRFIKLLGGSPLLGLLAAGMLWASPVLAEDAPVTYKLMMKASTSTERTTSEVLERGLTALRCVMRAVDTSGYHRGVIEGLTKGGGECFNATQKSDTNTITVRVTDCEDEKLWTETTYVCEEEQQAEAPVEPDKKE